jgi:tetratricopeptide (TPR) repeat protein
VTVHSRALLRVALAASLLAGLAEGSAAQSAALPASRADALLDAGRWADAGDVLYADARSHPRDPEARTRLGRYLAMKGALRPGLVLVDEAVEFGLSTETARALAAPIRTLLNWRDRELAAARDTTIQVRAPSSDDAILRFPVVRASGDTLWADLVPRMIGLDSASGSRPRVGIETIDALVPECDVVNGMMRLHADPRAAVAAPGRRYHVLRTASDVRVLLGPGRVSSLPDALRELAPRWWQLDLPHGVLVVR